MLITIFWHSLGLHYVDKYSIWQKDNVTNKINVFIRQNSDLCLLIHLFVHTKMSTYVWYVVKQEHFHVICQIGGNLADKGIPNEWPLPYLRSGLDIVFDLSKDRSWLMSFMTFQSIALSIMFIQLLDSNDNNISAKGHIFSQQRAGYL